MFLSRTKVPKTEEIHTFLRTFSDAPRIQSCENTFQPTPPQKPNQQSNIQPNKQPKTNKSSILKASIPIHHSQFSIQKFNIQHNLNTIDYPTVNLDLLCVIILLLKGHSLFDNEVNFTLDSFAKKESCSYCCISPNWSECSKQWSPTYHKEQIYDDKEGRIKSSLY